MTRRDVVSLVDLCGDGNSLRALHPQDSSRSEEAGGTAGRQTVIVTFLVGFLLVVSTMPTAGADPMQTALRDQVLDHAVNYLCENYNESIGLICESPDAPHLKDSYWIYSDNYLSSLVLRTYDPDNLTLTRLARDIDNNMRDYLSLAGVTDPINQYMVLTESLSFSEPPFNASVNSDLLEKDGAWIRTTQNNQSSLLSSKDYADIAFLQAVHYHERGREDEAMCAYLDGVRLYDGRGFKDEAYYGTGGTYPHYQTYKIALYLYASKLLGQDYDIQAFYTLLEMQQPNGGFSTSYDRASLNATGYTNTETTCLAILALNLQGSSSDSYELVYILLVVAAVGATLVLVFVWLKTVKKR